VVKNTIARFALLPPIVACLICIFFSAAQNAIPAESTTWNQTIDDANIAAYLLAHPPDQFNNTMLNAEGGNRALNTIYYNGGGNILLNATLSLASSWNMTSVNLQPGAELDISPYSDFMDSVTLDSAYLRADLYNLNDPSPDTNGLGISGKLLGLIPPDYYYQIVTSGGAGDSEDLLYWSEIFNGYGLYIGGAPGGTVIPESNQYTYQAGSTANIDIEPDEGYHISLIQVNTIAQPISNNKGMTLYINPVNTDLDVDVTFDPDGGGG
jgi:hypothetical protein